MGLTLCQALGVDAAGPGRLCRARGVSVRQPWGSGDIDDQEGLWGREPEVVPRQR